MNPPDPEDTQHVVDDVKRAISHMLEMPFSHSNVSRRREAWRRLSRRIERDLGLVDDKEG